MKVILLLLLSIILVSCADVEPNIKTCMHGHEYGFWSGLWHGFISPISFICSLVSDEIAVYAMNNNGGWYTFGFLLGACGLSRIEI
jgi:hypothetical protein